MSTGDNGPDGVLVLERTSRGWVPRRPKLVGTGGSGPYGSSQGTSVALAADGTTAIVGGNSDGAGIGAVWVFAAAPPADAFQVRYAANLNAGDSVINLTNTGAVTLPSNPSSTGNICANVYAFDASEEMISCCSCLMTPNGLNSLSVKTDLIANTLTLGAPVSVIIKLLATMPVGLSPAGTGGSCDPTSPNSIPAGPGVAGSLVPGMLAWGTTIHALSTTPLSYAVTEERFEPTTLSTAELTKLTMFCGFIQSTGSGFGICRSCRTGGLGGSARN